MLGAAIKQPIHHHPGIGYKRLTGTDFLEMEKILVMNGMSLLEFTSELMTSIYHLKKHCVVGPGWMLFLAVSGPREDHSGLGKYQSNTFACLYVTSLAIATSHWMSYSDKSHRGGTEIDYIIYKQWGNVTVLYLNKPYRFKYLIGCRSTHCACEIVDE